MSVKLPESSESEIDKTRRTGYKMNAVNSASRIAMIPLCHQSIRLPESVSVAVLSAIVLTDEPKFG